MRDLRSEDEIMASWKGEPNKPIVSICCIAYNHEPYIEDAIEGFLMQETGFPIEILIHDDASKDKTAEIIRKYEEKYPEIIKPIYQTINQFSLGKRINAEFNFTRAQGEFLAICEGDDYWTSPDKLSKQVEELSKQPSSTLSFHPVEVLSEKQKNKLFIDGYGYYGSAKQTLHAAQLISQAGPALAMCSIVVKREVIDNIKENSPEFFLNRMSHFFLQSIALMQGEACYVPDEMASYRYGHQGSWSNKCSINSSYRFNQIRKFLEALGELEDIFPHKHTDSVDCARRVKLKQAYRLTGVSIGDKINLYKTEDTRTFRGLIDLSKGQLLSWLLTIKNIVNPSNQSGKSEIK